MKKSYILPLVLLALFSLGYCNEVEKNSILKKPTLVLYCSGCPYCQKVFNYLSTIHKSIPLKDVTTNANYLNELKEIGGKAQVPCLVINGKALYESDMIIQWISENQDSLDPVPATSK